MVEKLETKPVSWPERYDPDAERILERTSLYIKIEKPKRLNKPTRTLTVLPPKTPEIIEEFGEFTEQYLMEMDGLGQAGGHRHERKTEIFCGLSRIPLFIFLEHIETGERAKIVLTNSDRENYTQYLIPPKVAHKIVNPSVGKALYLVLSTISEKEAISSGDVIDYPIDINKFTEPTSGGEENG